MRNEEIGGSRSCDDRTKARSRTVAEYLVGDEVTIRATIRNVSDHIASGIQVRLKAPFALEVADCERRWDRLAAGECREVTWSLRASAALQSGSLHVSVTTADSGSVVSRHAFRVHGRKSVIQASPAWQPERRR
jgi:uncharacterized membrane protein